MSAHLGLGALTFAFINAEEAKFWVDEYYETFKNECTPIGQSVNPNVAMLTGFMVHEDNEIAIKRGLVGSQFFAFGLGHYWRDGTHVPGQTNLWEEYNKMPNSSLEAMERQRKKAGMGGIGSPKNVAKNFRKLEEAGVDHLILLQQSGNYRHEHICESLEIFAKQVLPEFKEREAKREINKQNDLGPFVEKALSRVQTLEQMKEVPPVEAYPLVWKKQSTEIEEQIPDRRPGMSAFWQMQVGGKRS